MNFEYVYKINTPLISKIIPEIDLIKLKCKLPGPHSFSVDIMAPEYRNWLGIRWDNVLIFYKENGYCPKVAHIDSVDSIYNKTWGINFHYGGNGILEIYKNEDVTEIPIKSFGNSKNCVINGGPIKTYYMSEGAHLVFNALPHRATGFQQRFCVSLRCEKMYDRDPEEILNIFKDFIVV